MSRLSQLTVLLLMLICLSGCTTWRNDQGSAITLEDEQDCDLQCSYNAKRLTASGTAMCTDSCKRSKGFYPTSDE